MKKTKEELKTYFETGDKPTQEQYADLIDSYIDAKQPVGNDERRFVINGNGEVLVKSKLAIPEIQAGNNIIIDKSDPLNFVISSISKTDGDAVINTTHADLLSLISVNGLVPEQEYSFEFRNIYKQLDSDVVKQDSPIETLVVKAETTSSLYSTVRSLNYEEDKIGYDVNIVSFSGLDELGNSITNISNQGTILKRVDTALEIETPYDFRTEKFVRYKGVVPTHDQNTGYPRFSVVKAPNDLNFVRVAIENISSASNTNIDDVLKWQKMPFGSSLNALEDYKYTKNNSYLNIIVDTNDFEEFLTFSNTSKPTKEQAFKIKLYNRNIVFTNKAIDAEVKYFESDTVDGLTLKDCVDVKLHVGREESRNVAYSRGTPLIDSVIGLGKKLLVVNGDTRIEQVSNINITSVQSKVIKTIDSNPDLFISSGFMASLDSCNFTKQDAVVQSTRVVGNFFRRRVSGTFRNDMNFNFFINDVRDIYCGGYLNRCKVYANVYNVRFRGNVNFLDFVFDPSTNVIVPNESYTNLINFRDTVFDCDIDKLKIYYAKSPLGGSQTRIRLYKARFNTRELSGIWTIPTANTSPSQQYNYKFLFSNYFKDENDNITLFYEDVDKDGNVTNVPFVPELL